MKKLITAVEKYLGPKLSAVAVAATTAAGQLSSALGATSGELDIIGVLTNAAQTDLVSFLPAPIAGIAAYLMRSAKKPKKIKPATFIPAQHRLIEDLSLKASFAKQKSLETNAALITAEHNIKVLQSRMENLMKGFDGLQKDFGDDIQIIDERLMALEDKEDEIEMELEDKKAGVPFNIRQNNPGNIESTLPGGNKWKGEQDSTNRYAVFESPAYGVRAMMYLLKKVYYNRHGLTTIDKIIHRWAPLGDNSPESVNNYIDHVAKDLKIERDTILQIDVNDEQLVAMVKSMATFEGGRPPPYAKAVYTKALELLE